MSLPIITKHWPIIVTLSAGILAFGTLRADVVQLKTASQDVKTDHDLIVRVDERQKKLAEDVAEMKQDIKDIAQAVK